MYQKPNSAYNGIGKMGLGVLDSGEDGERNGVGVCGYIYNI